MNQEFLTYDDNWYIYENQNVIHLSWDSIKNIFSNPHAGQYSPIGEFSNSVIYYLSNGKVSGFKFFAFLIHLINSFLVFLIFSKLFNERKMPLFVGLVFLIHPVQVEVIAWASAIYRIAASFMLLGVWLYLKYRDTGKTLYFILVILCYALALLTKEQAVLFPLALLFVNFVKKEFQLRRRIIFENILLGLIAVSYVLFTLKTVTKNEDFTKDLFSFKEKLFLFSKAIVDYTFNFLCPTQLSFSYPAFIQGDLSQQKLLFNVFVLIALLSIAIYLSLRNRLLFAGLCWSLGFLSIALTFPFFSIREVFMADRYVYFAMIGMALVLYEIIRWLIEEKMKTFFLPEVALVYFLFLGVLCFQRVGVFKNSKTVWLDAIETDETNYLAHNSLGFYYRTNGENQKALKHYSNSIAINDNYYLSQSNIGKVYYDRKQYDSALYYVSNALRIQPYYKTGYKNRAAIFKQVNKLDSLLLDLNKLIVFYPKKTSYLKERALTYFKLKKYDLSRADAEKLISKTPNDHVIPYLIGHSSLLLKDFEKANSFMDKAVLLSPDNSNYLYIRSVCRFRSKRIKEALVDAVEAKNKGYKVQDLYIKLLISEVKKLNKKK